MIGAGRHTECMCNLTDSEKGRALKSLTSMPHCGFSEYSAVLKATCCSPILMLLQGENFLLLLCKLGFIAYPFKIYFYRHIFTWCIEKLLFSVALLLLRYGSHWCIGYLETDASHFQFSWYWNCAGNKT